MNYSITNHGGRIVSTLNWKVFIWERGESILSLIPVIWKEVLESVTHDQLEETI